MGPEKNEGADPLLPTPGKLNIDFVVEVLVAVVGVGWLAGIGNIGVGVVAASEAVVVSGEGAAGLEKKSGTVVVVEGSGFVMGAGKVVVAGLAKKSGTAGCAGAGPVFEGIGDGTAKRFFAGSLVSVVVTSVTGFGCVEATEAGVDKLGTAALAMDVVVAGAGAGGQGFFSSSAAFFVS